jgi:4-amino-4-deoxy-L-arabinose transferase-like glycosyltransferase
MRRFLKPFAPTDLADAAWLALVLIAALVYLYGLGSAYAPTNGDEMVYLHIARLTALSGHWLPLVSDLANMRNTKPPLLFWQAMAAGDWGHNWSLLALRLPSVAYTLATTALLACITYRISGRFSSACRAAALYLLFFSTFRYGRVYLTSAPETFWFSLPLFWLLWTQLRDGVRPAPQPGPIGWPAFTLFGLSMGLGMAYKSFALVAPAAATLWCAVVLSAPDFQWRSAVRTTLAVAWSTAIALGLFALWFVLDPDPAAVWREFVVGENAGKMSGEHGYWHAAVYGAYPVWTQLWAYPENAGLLMLPVFGLAWAVRRQAFQRRTYGALAPVYRVLLLWLAVWLVVFTLPSQRSARYVIAAMPALAILMALAWEKIARPWFWATLLLTAPALVMLGRVAWVMGELQIASATQIAMTLLAVCAGITVITAGFIVKKWTRATSLSSVLAVYAAFGLLVAPLSSSDAGYRSEVRNRIQGQRVAVPNGFTGQYERFTWILPGARLNPYDTDGRNTAALRPELEPELRLAYLLEQFDAVVWLQDRLDQPQPSCLPVCQLLGARWHVVSRHKSGEVNLGNVWYPQQWLFRREWLVAPSPVTAGGS